MLKGISPILTPELLKILAEMGHGDELVIGDCNFPAQSMGRRCVRCDGHRGTELLDAILALFPLDQFVEAPVTVMAPAPARWMETRRFGRSLPKSLKSISPARRAKRLIALPSMTALRMPMQPWQRVKTHFTLVSS